MKLMLFAAFLAGAVYMNNSSKAETHELHFTGSAPKIEQPDGKEHDSIIHARCQQEIDRMFEESNKRLAKQSDVAEYRIGL